MLIFTGIIKKHSYNLIFYPLQFFSRYNWFYYREILKPIRNNCLKGAGFLSPSIKLLNSK